MPVFESEVSPPKIRGKQPYRWSGHPSARTNTACCQGRFLVSWQTFTGKSSSRITVRIIDLVRDSIRHIPRLVRKSHLPPWLAVADCLCVYPCGSAVLPRFDLLRVREIISQGIIKFRCWLTADHRTGSSSTIITRVLTRLSGGWETRRCKLPVRLPWYISPCYMHSPWHLSSQEICTNSTANSKSKPSSWAEATSSTRSTAGRAMQTTSCTSARSIARISLSGCCSCLPFSGTGELVWRLALWWLRSE